MLLPLPFGLLLIFIGCLLLFTKNRIKIGRGFVIGGFIVLSFFGCATKAAESLIKGFEDQYPPVVNYQHDTGLKWIVVLGGGYLEAPGYPVTEQISLVSLLRLSEGIRIHNQLPHSKIIISSGKTIGASVPGSLLMADLAAEFGIEADKMVLESESRDTREQAVNINKIVKGDRFVLVTSALHMPRAMALFENLEMNPVPAPIFFIAKGKRHFKPNSFFPSVEGLSKSGLVIHEYLGLLWAKIRGHV